MKDWDVPIELRNAARNIVPDVFEHVHSLEELVQHFLIGVDEGDAKVIAAFFEQCFVENVSADEYAEFWTTMPSGIHFHDGSDVQRFMKKILMTLQSPRYVESIGYGKFST
jgi:hypothetical protein